MKLIFCHIPKTAGKSILGNIEKYIEKSRILKVYGNGGAVSMKDFAGFDLPNRWGVIAGHIPVMRLIQNRVLMTETMPITLFASVRDPIDRMISLYNFVRTNPKHPDFDEAGKSDPVRYLMKIAANPMFNFLGVPAGSTTPNWNIRIVPIGRVGETAAALTEVVIKGPVNKDDFRERRNVTAMRQEGKKALPMLMRDALPESIIGELNDKHRLDVALYQAVVKRDLTKLPTRTS